MSFQNYMKKWKELQMDATQMDAKQRMLYENVRQFWVVTINLNGIASFAAEASEIHRARPARLVLAELTASFPVLHVRCFLLFRQPLHQRSAQAAPGLHARFEPIAHGLQEDAKHAPPQSRTTELSESAPADRPPTCWSPGRRLACRRQI